MWIFVLGVLTLGACGVWTDTNMLDSRTAVISVVAAQFIAKAT